MDVTWLGVSDFIIMFHDTFVLRDLRKHEIRLIDVLCDKYFSQLLYFRKHFRTKTVLKQVISFILTNNQRALYSTFDIFFDTQRPSVGDNFF